MCPFYDTVPWQGLLGTVFLTDARNIKEACDQHLSGVRVSHGDYDDSGKIFRKLEDIVDEAWNDGDKPL